MAKGGAESQHTPIKDLDDALRYLVEELGYQDYAALWDMEARIWDGKLRLTRQRLVDGLPYSPSHYGKPYNQEPVNPAFFCNNLTLGFDSHDRVKVISRIAGFEWWVFRYRIAEGCDVRAIWPRRSPAQQNKLGAPLEHDWDDYKQRFLQLWQEKGDFQLPQNQVAGWNSQAAAARMLLGYIQTRIKDGEEPHEKTIEESYGRKSSARPWSVINYAPLRSITLRQIRTAGLLGCPETTNPSSL
jgi:hypothetical protein